MDFALTPEQRAFQQTVIRFATRELNDEVTPRDGRGEFSREAWNRCARFGIQGLPVPEAYGGAGADALQITLAMEALGYGCRDNGLLFSLNAQMWSCEMPLVRSGSEDQKRRYLPGLCDGRLIGVQAMTEPTSGSDAFGLRTTARRDGERYVLNGSKTFITNAPVADLFVVFATVDLDAPLKGLTAFLVERDAPGLTIGRPLHKMGLRTSPMAELAFEECVVPPAAVLGGVGAGAAIFTSSMDWERSCILGCALGTMRRQLERCIEYAKTRHQFGQPIGKFQAVSHTIAEMRVRLETARLFLYKVGWMKATGQRTGLESAMVKLYVSECFLQSSLDAVQVFGGYGYMAEYELERDLRDAVGSRIYSGTSEIQKNIIAAHLGL